MHDSALPMAKKTQVTAANKEAKFNMGADAARRGKSENDCPYSRFGWAWSHWIMGYRSIRPKS